MLKQHSHFTQLCLGAFDLIVIGLAWLLAYQIRFRFFPYSQIPPTRTVLMNLLVAMLVSVLVLAGSGLYRPRRDRTFLFELGGILKAGCLIWIILIVALYFLQHNRFTRGMLVLFLPLMMASLVLCRGLFKTGLRYVRRRGWNLRYALIVGTGRLGQAALHKLRANSWTGIRVAGFVDTHPVVMTNSIRDLPVLGTVDQLQTLVDERGIDSVFIALPNYHSETLRHVMRQLEDTAVDVRMVPDLYLSRFPMNIAISDLDGMPVISLRENPLAGWPGIYKRCFDVFGAAFGLAIFAVPMLLIAALIRASRSGPVIYRQRRVSYGGKAFDILKFRTMVVAAEDEHGPTHAQPNDPRCTRFGRWLRGTSLDELPQLWNVLIGHMSLVGPRPERPELLEKIRKEIPGFPLRLKVRAGLTGWAQINGFRGRTSFRKRLQYDLYYLNNWSPLLDFRIVFATIFRGFRHPNAY